MEKKQDEEAKYVETLHKAASSHLSTLDPFLVPPCAYSHATTHLFAGVQKSSKLSSWRWIAFFKDLTSESHINHLLAYGRGDES